MKKFLKGLLLFFFIVCALEIVSFIYIRKFHPEIRIFMNSLIKDLPLDEYQRCIPVPYLNYIPSPSRTEGGKLQHNAGGYRGDAVVLRKEKESAFRILFLGGSTTYGSVIPAPENTFPAKAGEYLQKKFRSMKVEVINAGLPWGTSAEMLTHYLFKFRYYKPDLVVIHAGANDAQALAHTDYQPDYSNFRRSIPSIPPVSKTAKRILRSNFISVVTYYLFYSNYRTLAFVHFGECPYAKWYDHDLPYSLHHVSEYAFYRNVLTIVKTAKEEGTGVVLFPEWGNPLLFTKLIKQETGLYGFNEKVLQKIAVEEKVSFLPFPKEKIPQNLWVDDIHVNETGDKFLGEYAGQFIEKTFFHPNADH